jgi:hypothetical protein
MTEATNEPQNELDPDTLRDDWLARMGDLVGKVKGWAEQSGWKNRAITNR